ncbi:MAG: rRNA maturation RNase YbeY [Bacteroidetes bacterium]|nr:rRNA maturation RNase YbeY [Bacteroidota bacterium]
MLLHLCQKEGKEVHEIRVIFCDKKMLRSINRQFLQHDYDTDIITFPFSSTDEPIEAELYISFPKIKEQAKEWQCSIKEELHRIIFHGVLHLCGYKDKKKKEIALMREKERQYLALYFKSFR